MHATSGSRFELVAADGAVNQAADLARINAGRLDRFASAFDAFFARSHAARPKPPLANSTHQLQATFWQPQTAIQRLQAAFDLVAGDGLVGNRIAERFDADVLVVHFFNI